VQIDRIILEGYSSAMNRQAFAIALQTKLHDLLVHGGCNTEIESGAAPAFIRADSIAAASEDGKSLGFETANAIYGTIGSADRAAQAEPPRRGTVVSVT